MIVHSYYDEDPRVRREAEALVAAGHEVDVFALRRPTDPVEGTLAGVRVHRHDVQRHQGAGIGVYLREYLSFLAQSSWSLVRAHRRRRYGLIQVHSLPDFLVFAALPLRMTGVPLLLDLHEAMPEFFRSRFPRASNPLVQRLLLAQERASIRLASDVLTVNGTLAARLVAKGVPARKVHTVVNRPSLERFDPAVYPARQFGEDGTIRLVYAGALTPMYELDVVLQGMARLAAARPELAIELDVYGRGDSETDLHALAGRVGRGDQVRFHGRIPIEAVPAAVAAADIGLAPTRRDAFTDASLSTKLFEYAAMGKPVVATALPLVERSFPAGTVWTYAAGDPDAIARTLAVVIDNDRARSAGVAAALDLVRDGSWERESIGYLAIVERLLAASANV